MTSTPEKPSPSRNPVPTSVTNVEEIMDNDITDTMVEIRTPTKPKASENLQDDIKLFIRTEILQQLQQHSSPGEHGKLYVDEIRQAHAFIDKFEEEYKTSAEKIRGRMGWVNANMESYEKKFHIRFDKGLEGLLESAQESV